MGVKEEEEAFELKRTQVFLTNDIKRIKGKLPLIGIRNKEDWFRKEQIISSKKNKIVKRKGEMKRLKKRNAQQEKIKTGITVLKMLFQY